MGETPLDYTRLQRQQVQDVRISIRSRRSAHTAEPIRQCHGGITEAVFQQEVCARLYVPYVKARPIAQLRTKLTTEGQHDLEKEKNHTCPMPRCGREGYLHDPLHWARCGPGQQHTFQKGFATRGSNAIEGILGSIINNAVGFRRTMKPRGLFKEKGRYADAIYTRKDGINVVVDVLVAQAHTGKYARRIFDDSKGPAKRTGSDWQNESALYAGA